jgi:hypothetical protein
MGSLFVVGSRVFLGKLLKNRFYVRKRELFGCYWKSYISFAVVGVSPTTLVACEDTSDGKKGNLYQRTKSLPAV